MSRNFIEMTKENFPHLTKGLKKVGDYLLSDPMIFAIHPAKKVGETIGVSETMIIRFCTSIGYSGFSELQKDVRNHLLDLKQESTNEHILENEPASNNYIESLKNDISNLSSASSQVDFENMDKIVESIINSEKVIVVGYYHSFTFAHWFYFNLTYTLGNASLYRPETDAGLLDLLPKNSCIIVFSFYRYALDTIRLAEEAKSKGIKVITITDSRVAPVSEFADIVLPINMAHSSLFSKGPVTLSIINSILNEIIHRVEKRGKIHTTYKYFIKDGEE
ncbi:MurR/RpiR family transcriptional regulator [Pseudalkalibacillus decolorationis]|uniref:MurR/RpiR family transcriptional regulator n=1 Tax=Pseudalkalibacillus decolorationis TaxID=163879 RepID=UPI0021490ACB|nr:MurR/RpiR family transcriptional regulator [Pseudalkalibacillus decolorationis]